MPLRLFPEWVSRIAYLTPFPYMLNTVVEIYLGVLSEAAMARALAMQLLWIVGLLLLAQLIFRSAVRRLVILGG